jgi:hypothetical protein
MPRKVPLLQPLTNFLSPPRERIKGEGVALKINEDGNIVVFGDTLIVLNEVQAFSLQGERHSRIYSLDTH